VGITGTPRYKDEIGHRYGNLVVIEFVEVKKYVPYWKCLCDCGEVKITRGGTLRSGQCKSCGKCDIRAPMPADAPYKRQWRNLHNIAKSRSSVVEISFDQYVALVHQNCGYCGQPPSDKHYAYGCRRAINIMLMDVAGNREALNMIRSRYSTE
jgi:hypothetical protein